MSSSSSEDIEISSAPILQVHSREDSSASPITPINMGEGDGGEYSESAPLSTNLEVGEQVPSVERMTQSTNTTTNNVTVGEQDTENQGGEEFHKPKRQTTSKVWLEFTEVTLSDGTKKVQCVHCKKKMALNTSGATSQYARHLKGCPRRKVVEDSQHLLNFQPGRSSIDELMRPPIVAPNSKYDHGRMREATAHWLLMHEHPFTIVEEEGFNFMMKIANPMFEKISRASLKSDCAKVYEMEKKKLKTLIKTVKRISITTDTWKSSNQRIEYMVITGHFIDQGWKLQKRVLSFVHIPPPRRGIDIADGLYKCLKEWGIENKVYTVSVDNASYNDVAVRTLRDNCSRVMALPCGGKLFHVRCCAHILNLLVQDGISQIVGIIDNVRESVKFIDQSEGRLLKFSEIVHQLQLPQRKLILDCPTRWNSTYDTLFAAMKFKDVFPRFKEREALYNNLPSEEDWMKVQAVCEVLSVFNAVTNIISGSEYPTSNLYLTEVFRVKHILDKNSLSENDFIRGMVGKMKEKFDKYWGDYNLLMALASVLDPRCKMRLVEFCFPKIYSEFEARRNIEKVKEALHDTYQYYLDLHNVSTTENSSNVDSTSTSTNIGASSSANLCMAEESGWSLGNSLEVLKLFNLKSLIFKFI